MNSNREATFWCHAKNRTFTALTILALASLFFNGTVVYAQENQQVSSSLEEMKGKGVIRAEIYPVNPQTDSKQKFYYELTPGSSISDKLWLINLSDADNNIEFYAVHGGLNSSGGIGYAIIKEDGTKELSKWTVLDYDNAPLGPNEQKQVSFTISIPEETPHGTYHGGFALERFVPAEGGNLNSAFRKIFPIEVKISDNPAPFKEYTANVFELPVYFWPALALFGLSVIYYLFSKFKDKKKINAN